MLRLLVICTALVAGSNLLLSCRPDPPAECESFLELPSARQVEVFDTFPIEKQLRLYTCDYRYHHPANPGLAFTLAERGESIVPFLIESLRRETDERNQEPIIHVFELMYRYGHLRGREDVVNAIRSTVSEMNRPAVKSASEGMLRSIEGQSSSSLPIN